MDNDVILPEQSFDIQADKPQEVKDQETAAEAIHRQFKKEIKDKKFPVVSKHINELIESYGDIKTLAEIKDSNERGVHALARAWFVSEMTGLLNFIQRTEDEDGGK